mgnify:CR=1 FL=1
MGRHIRRHTNGDACCAVYQQVGETCGQHNRLLAGVVIVRLEVYGYDGVREAYETGRGRVVIRAKAEIEQKADHELIVVTEIPYGVNRAELIKNIADLVVDKRLDGISNINDESDRDGMRIVITLKRCLR